MSVGKGGRSGKLVLKSLGIWDCILGAIGWKGLYQDMGFVFRLDDAALDVHVTLYVVNCGGIWGNRGKHPHGVNTR